MTDPVPWGEGGQRALEQWLSSHHIAGGRISDVRVLTGGTQNLLLRFTCGARDLVLRRPPPNRAGSEKTLRREHAVLAALAGTSVPHPRLRGLCEDRSIIGGPFLVTDEVRGFNATVVMPGRAGSDAAFRHGMGLSLVDGLVELAKVSPETEQLRSLGKLDGFIERQVGRWASQLEGYAMLEGWAGPDELGPVAEIGKWLDANRPDDFQPGLMHGDYHIANVMFRHDDGKLAAILDWEMAALGDPMLDLARLTTGWPNARNEGLLSLKVEPWTGFPGRDELVARYAACTGRSMRSLPWFEVLACYKFAIVLEGSHARGQAGMADPAVGERLHASARGLIAKATAIMGTH